MHAGCSAATHSPPAPSPRTSSCNVKAQRACAPRRHQVHVSGPASAGAGTQEARPLGSSTAADASTSSTTAESAKQLKWLDREVKAGRAPSGQLDPSSAGERPPLRSDLYLRSYSKKPRCVATSSLRSSAQCHDASNSPLKVCPPPHAVPTARAGTSGAPSCGGCGCSRAAAPPPPPASSGAHAVSASSRRASASAPSAPPSPPRCAAPRSRYAAPTSFASYTTPKRRACAPRLRSAPPPPTVLHTAKHP